MIKTVIVITIYSLVFFASAIVIVKEKYDKKHWNILVRYIYSLIVALAFIIVGRTPFSVLHYIKAYGIITSVVVMSFIIYLLFSAYFMNLVWNKIYKQEKNSTVIDCNAKIGCSTSKSIFLVVLPISILLASLFWSARFSLPSIALVFEVALIAPVYEEVGFRLIIPRIVSGENNISLMLTVVCSFIFAALHVEEGKNIFFYLTIFISSLYSYYIKNITRTIKYPILYHVLGNLVRICFIY